MTPHTTTCPICESTSTTKSANTKYYSPECKKEAKRKADREYKRKWRAENPERNAELRKREDPELRRQRTKRCRDNNPERAHALAKAYRQANRERETARVRRWINTPKGRESAKASYRRWAIRNPEKAGKIKARRARAEANGNATPELIEAKWEASDKTCCLCGHPIDRTLRSPHTDSYTLEHLTPIARGGTHDIDNIDFAHRSCNTSKGIKTLEEYMEAKRPAA